MSDVNNLMAVRLEKRAELEAAGRRPYGGAFPVSGDVGDVRAAFSEGRKVAVAGRVTARRDMGKSHFLDVSDHTGRMQVYLQDKTLGADGVEVYTKLDIGDFIGVEEVLHDENREPSVRADRFVLLAKSLRPRRKMARFMSMRHRQRI